MPPAASGCPRKPCATASPRPATPSTSSRCPAAATRSTARIAPAARSRSTTTPPMVAWSSNATRTEEAAMGTIMQSAAGHRADTGPRTVKVWDPLVRLFHWSLAACILGAFLVEEGDTAHQLLGYTALALIALRVLWGLVGPRPARFGSWVRGPRAVAAYVRERIAGRSRRRLGHNPAAAVMILV